MKAFLSRQGGLHASPSDPSPLEALPRCPLKAPMREQTRPTRRFIHPPSSRPRTKSRTQR